MKSVLTLMAAAIALATTFLAGCCCKRSVDERPPVQALSGIGLDGQTVNLLPDPKVQAVVLIFVRTDCPLSNRYAPEVQRLSSRFGPQGLAFWLIYPDADTNRQEIFQHLESYRLSVGALRDPDHALVRRTGVRVTPEVAVFSPKGVMVYRGRIDNRAVDLGIERPAPTRHDLEEVLTAIIKGKPVTTAVTTPVGCYLSENP